LDLLEQPDAEGHRLPERFLRAFGGRFRGGCLVATTPIGGSEIVNPWD
jgi:hypothetical protein